jgi:hypothetical protein
MGLEMAEIEFTVEALFIDDGTVFVDGRVCKEPIWLGDVFTRLYGYSQVWDPSQGEWVDTDPGPNQAVILRIDSIESYGRLWNELPSGMTARLGLSGKGSEFLQQGKLLGGEVFRTII